MKATKPSEVRLYRLLFFVSSFIFLSFVVGAAIFGQISVKVELSFLVATVSFFIYAFFYLLDPESKKVGSSTKIVLLLAFLVSLANLLLLPILAPQISTTILAYFVTAYEYIGLFVLLVLPLFFLIFFGIWIFNQGHKRIGYAMIAVAIALVAFYFAEGLIFQHYKIDDEIFILLLDTKMLLAGANPYSTSVSQQLFYNVTGGVVNTPSINSQNMVIGTLSYPSLYLLSFVPFYLLSDSGIQGLIAVGLKVQEALFLLIALIATAFVIDKKLLGKPIYSLILFTTIALSYLSSIAIYLMFALLLLAYSKLEGKYSWIFLGLCASLQQQLWLPVILLILYSFNNQGAGKGIRNVVGTLGVFLLFNFYFIALNPLAFFGNLFGTLSGLLLPVSFSSIGYMIVTNYPILLGSYSILFWASVAIVCLIFLYINEKRLVGLFAMIPFIFNSHSIPVYYTFFTGFLIVTLFVKSPKAPGVLKKLLVANKSLVYATILAIVILASIYAYASHAEYEKDFNLSLSGSSIYFDSAANQTIYSGTLSYSNISNSSVYALAVVVSKYGIGYEGLLNQSILYQRSPGCLSYPCIVNINKIPLNGSGKYTLRVLLGRGQYLEPVYGVRMIFYNDQYFYISDTLFNQTILSSFSRG